MCCFSRPVAFVRATKIFARAEDSYRQFLAYSMTVAATEDLAMILPLPVRAGSGDGAVAFLNLQGYPKLFDDLEKGFPKQATWTIGPIGCATPKPSASALPVVEVGSFEATFVPSLADFDRLDDRFRLPAGTWDKLPDYHHYGFAVFKLKPGAKTVHPMAFSFPRAKIGSLFFPTVHIHDGEVHNRAEFDHLLYCQRSEGDGAQLGDWRESPLLAREFVKTGQTKGLVAADRHCYRKPLRGMLENRDWWV